MKKGLSKKEAIVLSMTKKERINPIILNNPSGEKRIVVGKWNNYF